MAINTSNYFKSKDVKAFPCSYRGNYGNSNSYTFDPESRLNTEYNFTHIGGHDENYVINYDTADKILYIVLGGYYFEISNIDTYDLSNKYLSIATKPVTIKEDDGTDSERVTYVLKSRDRDDADLDEEAENGEYYFTGIFISNNDAGRNCLKVFLTYPEIYQPSLKPNIKHGTGKKAILANNAFEASSENAFAEGDNTIASGKASHAEGSAATASGEAAHAEGTGTVASGKYTHAEGNGSTASGSYAHAEGRLTTASKNGAHAEGDTTVASGDYSHAEGVETIANKKGAHSGGDHTIASRNYQTVIGKYNKEEDGEFIVGIGNNNESRINALVVDDKETTVKHTIEVINDEDITTFKTEPTKTEIKTATNNIEGTTNTILGETNSITGAASNTITGSTTIEGSENSSVKITVDDVSRIHLQDTADSEIAITRGGSNNNTKQINLKSTNIISTAGTNILEGKNIVINGTGSTGTITAKVNERNKIVVKNAETLINNDTVNIEGTTTIKQSDSNKIEVSSAGTKITGRKTTITNGTTGKGVEVNVTAQGTQINLDGNDLFTKWIKEYILATAYPVGSIYISVFQNEKTKDEAGKYGCPIASELGGKWERFAGARGLVGYGSTTDKNNEKISFTDVDGEGWGYNSIPVFKHTHSSEVTQQPTIDAPESSFELRGRRMQEGQFTVEATNSGGNFSIGKTSYESNEVAAIDYHKNFARTIQKITFKNEHTLGNVGIQVNNVNSPTTTVDWAANNGRNWQPSVCVYMWKRVED